jgi:transcriptional regulator with XRE-family HTH domain
MIQFPNSTRSCRRCKMSLDPAPHPTAPDPTPAPVAFVSVSVSARLAVTIKALRLKRGFSQRQLAARMNTPRTYCSKLEQDKCCPTLSSLENIAAALTVPMADLLAGPEQTRQAEVRELATDPFVAELLPFVSGLDEMQRRTLLIEVRTISDRRRMAHQRSIGQFVHDGPSPRTPSAAAWLAALGLSRPDERRP